MADLAGPEVAVWQVLEARAHDLLKRHGYAEVRTPILEPTDLFARGLGDTTDVVQKEMYTFTDRGGRSLTLRPEGTASVIRHVAARGAEGLSARLYYLGPMFRNERPQAGRRRQFHQVGLERLGEPDPLADAEVIALQVDLLADWGLEGTRLLVNTRGTPEDRVAVSKGLQVALRPLAEALCEDCRRRIDTNPLRVLDCKRPACQEATRDVPSPVSWMSPESRVYFDTVVRALGAMGLDAEPTPRLVRGLDYYVHTVWEITHPGLGAQDAVAGGGRYLLPLEGKGIPGVGFAVGMERAVLALESAGRLPEPPRPPHVVFLAGLGQAEGLANLGLARDLRRSGLTVLAGDCHRSLKSQLKSADKASADWALIRGEDELARREVTLRRLRDGWQTTVPDDPDAVRNALVETNES